ncbi:enhanced intracellular survival protein Eis [Streptomyces sp. NPDC057638]|uniref:GNAT family N-acetyltransferase n=1 Tax=Streptomyces sp. NPDC057638 TaxID=3346190 RepID=UPI0036908C6D
MVRLPDAGPLRASERDEAVALLTHSFGTRDEARAHLHGLPPEQTFAVRGPDGLAAVVRWESAEIGLFGRPTPIAVRGLITTHPSVRHQSVLAPYGERVLGLLRDQGHVLAGWKTAVPRWWRGFGFGPCAAVHRFTGAPGQLSPVHELGTGEADPAPGPAELTALHREYAARRFGMLTRDEDHWEVLRCPASGDLRRDTVLWRATDGAPEGYVRYRHTRATGRTGGPELVVDELVALTPGAYLGLLGFLADHSTVTSFRWDAPPDTPLTSVVREPGELRPSVVGGERVLRVVDFATLALPATCPDPRAAEGLLLAVPDDVAPWNRGPWRVELDGGLFRFRPVRAARVDAIAQITVHAVAPLLARHLTLDQALLGGLITLPGPLARTRLGALLPPSPPPYCPDEW